MDGPDPGHDGRRDLRAQPRDELVRLPQGGRALLGAVAEPRLRRHGRPHRLPGARQDPGPALRDAGRASRFLARARLGLAVGLEGLRARSTRCRTPSTPPRASSSRPTRPSRRARRPFLTSEWDYGFRAQRIRTLLASTPKVSAATMSQIQGDTRNTYAPGLVERLLAVQVDDFTAQAQRLLRDWDGSQPNDKSRDAASAAYYNAVWKYLLQYTFDELPPDIAPDGGSRWMVVMEQLLKDPKNDWWDDKTTPGRHRGLRRDPQAGARRGPSRPRPRARQGPRDVAVGAPAPARPEAPGDGRRRGARRSSRTSSTATASSSAVATPSSTPTRGTPRSPATT